MSRALVDAAIVGLASGEDLTLCAALVTADEAADFARGARAFGVCYTCVLLCLFLIEAREGADLDAIRATLN